MKFLFNNSADFIKLILILSFLSFAGTGCKGRYEPGSEKKDGIEYLNCSDIESEIDEQTIKVGILTLEQNKSEITIKGIPTSIIKLGLLAGIHDSSKSTGENISEFIQQFKRTRVQAIAVLGGLGTLHTEIEESLNILKQAAVPILLIPGADESFPEFHKALAKFRVKNPQFIDMTRVRKVIMKQVALISLPGYTNPYYLDAKDQGCSFSSNDIENLENFTDSKHVPVLLSPTPPKTSGNTGPDTGRGSINIGDSEITKFMIDNKVNFALSGIIYESGGNGVSIKKFKPVQKGIWSTSLLLQTGSGAATAIELADKGRSSGMAQIVEFSGNKGRYKTLYPN
ncbi:MAG: hypothetical protein JXR91_16600 [Deltaproteobacteria bacterium]|nr:hypothetical protein [Deltaproteobacteria bacterium]